MKRYFCIPLYPILKSGFLRKELEFSYYLEQALLAQFKQFFKLSWTCWFCVVFILMFYNVFITGASTLAKTIFFMTIPIIGVALVTLVYFYCSRIAYRKIVPEITEKNIGDFKDFDYNSNEIFQQIPRVK